MRLSDTQLNQLQTDGYVIIDCPFDRALTDACLDAVNRVAVTPESIAPDAKQNHYTLSPQFPDSFWCHLDHSLPFLKTELHPEILEIARQLEGSDDIYYRNGGINELAPGRGFLWHRDTEWDYIEFMHYFSDATVEDGCLRVIPGSHVGEKDQWMDEVVMLRSEQCFEDPPKMEGPADVAMMDEIPLEVTSNQLIVRSSKIVHATWKNLGDSGRLMHHWIFRHPTEDNHRFTWRDYLTDELIDSLTEEEKQPLWLDRDFETHQKYAPERERELGKVRWGVV